MNFHGQFSHCLVSQDQLFCFGMLAVETAHCFVKFNYGSPRLSPKININLSFFPQLGIFNEYLYSCLYRIQARFCWQLKTYLWPIEHDATSRQICRNSGSSKTSYATNIKENKNLYLSRKIQFKYYLHVTSVHSGNTTVQTSNKVGVDSVAACPSLVS